MSDVVLTEKSLIPDDSQLKATLDTAYPFFKQLEELTGTYAHECKFYNNKSGWTYKVSDKKKALFWITPLQGNFNIGFALRESEKETLLNNNIATDLKEKLSTAEKFPEGFALRLNIKNEDDFKNLVFIVNIIMKLRV
jgi:hypothetical protein